MVGRSGRTGGRRRRPEEDAMDEQATEYSLLAEDRGMLVSGIGLLSVGSVVMLIGGLITSAVAVRATRRWVEHLDDLGVKHSAIIEASIGWLLIFDDPDGLTLHLYTWGEHGMEVSDRPGYGKAITDPDGWQPS